MQGFIWDYVLESTLKIVLKPVNTMKVYDYVIIDPSQFMVSKCGTRV